MFKSLKQYLNIMRKMDINTVFFFSTPTNKKRQNLSILPLFASDNQLFIVERETGLKPATPSLEG